MLARLRPLLLGGALLAAAACGGGDGGTGPAPEPAPQPAKPAVPFSLAVDTVWIASAGDTAHLQVVRADGLPADVPELAWRALEPGVASVGAEGVVTAQSPGTTRVVAEARGIADTVAVKVVRYVSLGVGPYHTCAVTADGATHCWGSNAGTSGLLGRQSADACQLESTVFTCGLTPLRVPGVPAMSRVFAGFVNSCAATPAGQGWCWGVSAGTSGSREPSPPAPLLAGPAVETLILNGLPSCLLTPEGAPYCWGDVVTGGGPQPVAGGLRYSAYAVSRMHCGIERGTTRISCTGGTPPAGLADRAWTQLVADWDHYQRFCSLDTAGSAWCWGDGPALDKVSGSVALARITGGRSHRCGLTAAGQAFCWGANGYGQLGRGTATEALAIDSVAGGLRFAALGAGERHTCGLTTAGALYCWGEGTTGEVGDGFRMAQRQPSRVKPSRSPG